MLTVEKIGGTSMSCFGDCLKNIFQKQRTNDGLFNRIFIVSAYADVTNWLLEHKKTGKDGVYSLFASGNGYAEALLTLQAKLIEINHGFTSLGLDTTDADSYIIDRLKKTKAYLDSIHHILASGYVNKEHLLLAAREILASVGESHSAYNSVKILNTHGIETKLVDLSGFYDTDALTIDQRISKEFRNINFSKTIVVATGYTSGTEGIMREFDRGYSEITFAKVAVEVEADEAIIHKEFHLSSADPKIVGKELSVPVGFTNFDVADQLADIGMEAVHPKASKPLEKKKIALRIKNTFEPDHPGTLITTDYIGKESRVEIVTGSKKVALIEIHDSSMVGRPGFDLSILEIFNKKNISYIMKATNANSITHVIWEKDVSDNLLSELNARFELVTARNVAVVCAIGSNIAKPGVLAHAAQTLAAHKINIDCISQSLRQVNMQFVVSREQYEKAIIALNSELCVK